MNKRKLMSLVLAAALVMTGCGAGSSGKTSAASSAPAASTEATGSESAAAGAAAASTEAYSATETAQAAQAEDTAEKVVSGSCSQTSRIKICGDSIYAAGDMTLLKADAAGLTESRVVYSTDDFFSKIISMAADEKSGSVYLLVRTGNTIAGDGGNQYTGLQLVTVNKDGETHFTDLVDPNTYTELDCTDGVLYAYGIGNESIDDAEELTKLVYHKAYTIADDGTLTETSDDRYDSLCDAMPTGFSPVTQYSAALSSYYSIPWCMEKYGCIYAAKDDESGSVYRIDVKSDDTLSDPVKILDSGNEQFVGFTDSYLLTYEYVSEKKEYDYYYTDLKSGDKELCVEIPDSDKYVTAADSPSVFDFDDEAIYIGMADEAKKDGTYTVTKYPLKNGANAGESWNIGKADNNVSFIDFLNTSAGAYYAMDDTDSSRYLSFEGDGKKITAETPVFDSGLKAAGISVKEDDKDLYYDDDPEKEYYRGETAYPVFSANDVTSKEAADKLNAIMEKDYAYNDGDIASAKDDYKDYGDEGGFPYSLTVNINGMKFMNDDYMCLGMYIYEYTGGAHGDGFSRYYTIDRKTGDVLKLSDIIDESSDDFMKLVKKDLQAAMDRQGASSFFVTSDEAIKNYKSMDDLTWYITNKGLAIEFGDYELSSYASGHQTLVIPYSELKFKKAFSSSM